MFLRLTLFSRTRSLPACSALFGALLSAGCSERATQEAPAIETATFVVEGQTFRLAGTATGVDELQPGLGFVRPAPLSNALLKPGQEPRSLVKTFSTSLRRPGSDGPKTLYRVKFRSSKHEEFRQLLFERRVVGPSGDLRLGYELKIDGARTSNGREFWMVLEPNGTGRGAFSVAPTGRFDLEARRLDVALLERMPGAEPRRFELSFAVDEDFVFRHLPR